jgi:ATP-binding cassette subfamily B protein
MAFGAKAKLKNPKITLKRLMTYLAGKKGVMLAVMVLCVITTLISVVMTRLNGQIVDLIDEGIKAATGIDMKSIISLCLLMLTLVSISALSNFFSNRVMVRIAQRTGAQIREELFVDVQRLPLAFYDKTPSGDIMSRVINDVDNFSMALSQSVIQLVSGIISLVSERNLQNNSLEVKSISKKNH